MAYACDLGNSHTVYVDNQDTQTVITIAGGQPGQQQQSSSSLQTGRWILPPQLYRTANGAILKITTAQGESHIQIQGTSMSTLNSPPGLGSSQQMQMHSVTSPGTASFPSMQPMKPMEPMKMGNMQMNLNPMEMKMGNMQMRMGDKPKGMKQFCSQCGAKVQPTDRFCSSCGHSLN